MREGCKKVPFSVLQEENGHFTNFHFEGGYQCRQKNRTNFAQYISYRANDAPFYKTIPTFVTQSVRAPETAKVSQVEPWSCRVRQGKRYHRNWKTHSTSPELLYQRLQKEKNCNRRTNPSSSIQPEPFACFRDLINRYYAFKTVLISPKVPNNVACLDCWNAMHSQSQQKISSWKLNFCSTNL